MRRYLHSPDTGEELWANDANEAKDKLFYALGYEEGDDPDEDGFDLMVMREDVVLRYYPNWNEMRDDERDNARCDLEEEHQDELD